MKVASTSLEIVRNSNYLESHLTNQTCFHEEIKNRLNSGSAYWDLVQSLLSSPFLSKNIKIKIQRTIILLVVVLHGCDTQSVTLVEGHRMRALEKGC